MKNVKKNPIRLTALFLVIAIIASMCIYANAAEVIHHEESVASAECAMNTNYAKHQIYQKETAVKDLENIKATMMRIAIKEKIE